MSDSKYIRRVLVKLKHQAEAKARQHPPIQHMLVLPPGYSIKVPPMGASGLEFFGGQKPRHIVDFGGTKIATALPPGQFWPKGVDPLLAIAAEAEVSPYRPLEQVPHRVHLFFGRRDGLDAFKSLAHDIVDVAPDVIRAVFNNPKLGSDAYEEEETWEDVFHRLSPILHGGPDIEALDTWLCTMHWWSWKAADLPHFTSPRAVHAGVAYNVHFLAHEFEKRLSFSTLTCDVFTASAATLDLLSQFLQKKPPAQWRRSYVFTPEPTTLTSTQVVDWIERLKGYIQDWFKADEHVLPVAFSPEDLDNPALDEADRKRAKALALCQEHGEILAAVLERVGVPSTDLVRLLHCMSSFDVKQAQAVLDDAMTALDRAAMRLRQGLTSWPGCGVVQRDNTIKPFLSSDPRFVGETHGHPYGSKESGQQHENAIDRTPITTHLVSSPQEDTSRSGKGLPILASSSHLSATATSFPANGCSENIMEFPSRTIARTLATANIELASPEFDVSKQLANLERETPPLDKDNGLWVTNKLAANLENLKVKTLADYRCAGISNAMDFLGIDTHGRIWRREGTATSHPWYLKASLRSASKKAT